MKGTTILAAAIIAAFAIAQDAVKIAWIAKKGDTAKYRITSTSKGDFGQGPMEIKFAATLHQTVSDVKANGDVVVDEKTKEMSLMFNGQDSGFINADMTQTATVTMKPSGRTIEKKSDEPEEFKNPRLDQADEFIYPDKALKPGETWTDKIAADGNKKTRAAESTYTFVGVETVDGKKAYKITKKYKETEGDSPMNLDSTIYLLADNGLLYKAESKVHNVVFGPGEPTDASITIKKID